LVVLAQGSGEVLATLLTRESFFASPVLLSLPLPHPHRTLVRLFAYTALSSQC
jgi:hypothetical protein